MSQLSNSVSNFVICSNCDRQNPHTGKFCIQCGDQLRLQVNKPSKSKQKQIRHAENKILVLASNPSGTERIQLNPEIRSIKQSHERSPKRDEFTILSEPAIRISELQRVILKEKPRIIHFCGHGTGHQGLVLENDAGQAQLVSTEALTNLLQIFQRRIECVILNACHSHVQGERINQHVNFLIATKKEIRDDAALLFTEGFYDALFNGETYQDAYELGCNRIHLELYKGNNSERKLVPVYSKPESKYFNLEQHQVLLFLQKNPPNIIFHDHIPISNYIYEENVENEFQTENNLPCPYRGLFHFSPNDAEFFFGRDVFIEELFSATQTKTFIPVLGASGSGKSSVVLAGLVPKLEQEGNWKFAHFRPGDEPFYALAKALLPLYDLELNPIEQLKQSRQLAEYLIEGSILLKDVFAQIEGNYPNQRVLLIADQFEELYSLCPNEKIRYSFLDLLLACFQSLLSGLQQSPILVTTIRADFLGNFLAYPPLGDVLNSDIKLGAMNRKELFKVIVNPAAMLGVEFEPGLTERILDDVEHEPGNLALLEFALTELWQERTGNQLTHQSYEKIGRVEGALADYAERKYQELQGIELEQARQIFIQLVNPGEDNNHTRRRVNRNLIGENNWYLVSRKGGLADSRLVVTSLGIDEQEKLEVVHEALIRHWKRLSQWLNEDRRNFNKQRHLDTAAQEWDKSGRKPDYLLSNIRLLEAKEFQKKHQEKHPLSELAEEFVANSISYQRWRIIKSLVLFLIIPLVGIPIVSNRIATQKEVNRYKKAVKDCKERKKCHNIVPIVQDLVKDRINFLEFKDLKNLPLKGLELYDIYIDKIKLEGANLEDAQLINVRVRHANLKDVNLEDALLTDSNFRDTNLEGANLRHAQLKSGSLENAILNNANLEGADLQKTNFPGVHLEDTNLRHANLVNARNITLSKLKTACYWEEAIYKGNWSWNNETETWVPDNEQAKKDNMEYIEELKSSGFLKRNCNIWE